MYTISYLSGKNANYSEFTICPAEETGLHPYVGEFVLWNMTDMKELQH